MGVFMIIGLGIVVGALILGAVLLIRFALQNDNNKFLSVSNLSQVRRFYNNCSSTNKSLIYVDMKFDPMKDMHSKTEVQRTVDFCIMTLLHALKKGLGDIVSPIDDSSYVVVSEINADRFVSMCEYYFEQVSEYVVKNKLSEAPLVRFGMYTPRDFEIKFDESVVNAKQTYRYAVANNKDYAVCDNETLYNFAEAKQLEKYIVNAIDTNEFHIMMQPYINVETQEIAGCEVLARLKHPICGLVMPNTFIEIISRKKLNVQFDFCIFEKCCKWIGSRTPEEIDGKVVSCNFSRATISHGDFADKVIQMIEKHKVPVKNLAIEFTESENETNKSAVIKNLNALRDYGISIYLDDYGSSLTSYEDIINYPISVLKIDKEILYNTNTATGKAIFKNIVALANKLDLPLLCEGAETSEQVDFIRGENVQFIQGFFYYMPMESYECISEFKKEKD